MVTVATSFDGPIKIVFPKDLLVNWLAADKHAMLGLGDIVLPGIGIALLRRFDHSIGQGFPWYFAVTLLAYVAGLVLTMVVMHCFKTAQPALL